MSTHKQEILRCPHCGHDGFHAKIVGTETVRYVRGQEEVVSTHLDDESANALKTCAGCGKPFDQSFIEAHKEAWGEP
jgi:transcription elongation factor Elf1